MGLLQEFRQFALRGSATDIGVGVVVGAAFSSFVNSFVKDILLPPIGFLYSKINLQQLYFNLNGDTYPSLEKAEEAGAITINYGLFISEFIRFMIILFVVFIVIRQINRWKKPHQHPLDSMTKKECPYCKMPIPSSAIVCPNCASPLKKKGPQATGPKWRVK